MRLSLFPTAEAPAEARRGLAILSEQIDPGSLAEVRAVVSELVALSVTRGTKRLIDMELHLRDDMVEGVIDDHGPASREIVRMRQRQENPFAVMIIDSLVQDWGTTVGDTAIWFRIPVHPARYAPMHVGAS
jgi:hypothetical protein